MKKGRFYEFYENYYAGINNYARKQEPVGITEEKSIDDLEAELDQEIGKTKQEVDQTDPAAQDTDKEAPAIIPDSNTPVENPEQDPTKNQEFAGPQPLDQTATAEVPQNKIATMFNETGNVDIDYSLTNPNNISLAVFKFTNAGIDPLQLTSKEDLKNGIPVDEMESFLTPEQKDAYSQSNKNLRAEYPAIDKREKYIIIHNSSIPLSKKNEQGIEVTVPPSQKSVAYEKINSYMETKFGKGWQDKQKSKTFLKSIKVNFSDRPYVRMNVSKIKDVFPANTGEPVSYYGKLMIENPSWLDDFVSKNKNDENFKGSSIFRSISNSYNNQEGDSTCVILDTTLIEQYTKGEEKPVEATDVEEDPVQGEKDDAAEEKTADDTEEVLDIDGEETAPSKDDEEVQI